MSGRCVSRRPLEHKERDDGLLALATPLPQISCRARESGYGCDGDEDRNHDSSPTMLDNRTRIKIQMS